MNRLFSFLSISLFPLVLLATSASPVFALDTKDASQTEGAKKVLKVKTAEEASEVTSKPPKPEDLLSFPLASVEVESVVETHFFVVELALDGPHWSQGLMWRTELADDKGMIFMFPDEELRSFWMRNTLIPLDLIYVDTDGFIVHIHENAKPLDESPLPSIYPARAVFEVRAGLTADLGIQVGDKVRNLKPFGPLNQKVGSFK